MNKCNSYKIGFAPSDIANNINPKFRLPSAISSLSAFAIRECSGLELELEDNFDIGDYRKPSDLVFLGVHQPSTGVDVNDKDTRIESIEKIQQSMLMAQKINADYFTVHLQTVDRWQGEESRKYLAQESLGVFDKLLDFYHTEGLNFPIYIENLEYPKYPATIEEIQQTLEFIAERPGLQGGVVLDAGHLWRTRNLMAENHIDHNGQDWPYSKYLSKALDEIDDNIKVFHLTGCGGYRTHMLPQVENSEPLNGDLLPSEYYFRSLAKLVLKFVTDKNYSPYIVNEAFGHAYEEVVHNNMKIIEINHD